ncbi:M1 family metallopeptidase [Ferruginibacter sp.]
MKKFFFLILFFYSQLPIAHCQPFDKAQGDNYWQQQVNYKIDVALNDTSHTLDGYIKMDYFNNSPDTIFFIWIHLWPNAFKNDRTAFTDQMLENGSTAFYFSDDDKRGYINRLNFKVNTITAKTEDHPQHQDIIKLILPTPLLPKTNCKIETPFHVKIPENFSRGGHNGQAYQITQWYPKPAVYDKKGWHPIPYLDQGEFYSEFGNYEVQVTLPKNYVVAATGELQEADEKEWLQNRKLFTRNKDKKEKQKTSTVVSDEENKTLHYIQNNVHDFAWFADKTFSVATDTIQLPSGRIINAYAFYYAENKEIWDNSIALTKQAILTKSKWIGEYPYNIVSVVEDEKEGGGMEYPTITYLSSGGSEKMLDFVINHEVGHNWFYGILASNERTHSWMDEGMNTHYDNRYALQYYKNTSYYITSNSPFLKKRMPDDLQQPILQTIIDVKRDQPIETVSEKFSELNYGMIAYIKTGQWMQLLENELGKDVFDSCMKEYYRRWSFKHPYPEDFKKVMEEVSGKNLDATFALQNKKGALTKTVVKKDLRFASFFSLKETDKHNYIFASPVIGVNLYDKLMIGAVLHNYTLPTTKLQFVAVPLFATGSKKINGIGRVSYSWYPDNSFQKIEIGLNGSRFSSNHSLDTTGKKIFENFYKIVPHVRLYFKHGYRSSISSWLDVRLFAIGENEFDNFEYKTGSDSTVIYPTRLKSATRYINQLTFNIDNSRVLYPYNFQLQLQQGEGFYRFNATGNYFFNYSKGGGLQARIFAAKFGYTGSRNNTAYLYQPKLLAGNGQEDYTYSNYFLGRTASPAYGKIAIENGGIAAQQVMIQNTGGLKLRLDQYSSVQGYSENWVAAFNVNSTLPEKLFPVKLPLKIFFDGGSYAEAWRKNAFTPKFLYTAGLQVSLLKNVLNIYVPLLYSKVFKEQLKTDKEANRLIKKITFSIDIQNFSLRKLAPQIPF